MPRIVKSPRVDKALFRSDRGHEAIPRHDPKGWGSGASQGSTRRARRATYYLVVWWMSQHPYAAVFENRLAAEAASRVRNALLITMSGENLRVDGVEDRYRRDEEGEPMPAEWRDLVGQIRVPWAMEPEEAAA